MSLNKASQVRQFLDLQKKSLEELQSVCEGLNLSIEGSHESLVLRLIEQEASPQLRAFDPQLIPLRTRDSSQVALPGAAETFKKWRRHIFEGKRNVKDFSLLNNNGKPYTLSMKHARCSTENLRTILEQGWYLPVESQRDLLLALHRAPERFIAHLVQKPDQRNRFWLMLHVEFKDKI